MPSLRVYLLIALVTSLAGCPGIYSEQPLGDEAVVLDPVKMNGTWLADGGELLGVRVLNDRRDTLFFWTVRPNSPKESPDKCEPPPNIPPSCVLNVFSNVDECTVTVRRHVLHETTSTYADFPYGRSFYFFSERVEGPDKEVLYLTSGLGRSNERSVTVLYQFHYGAVLSEWPGTKRLKALVEKGALPGHVDPDGTVILGALSPEQYWLIVSPESGVFDWTTPRPLIKLPEDLDPCKKGAKAE